ncbi:MAG: DUF2807 domain-containing protein [Flavobacteriales bacterium]|nr:DUF2807 domain-containing protein [Flavobacteriales bacterium]
MRNLVSTFILALAFALIHQGCIDCVQGEGEQVSESRAVVDFEVLRLDCSADVEIRENLISEKNSVEVFAQENLLPYIKTTSEGKKLTIDVEGCISHTEPIRVVVYTNGLDKIIHNGSGSLSTQNALRGDELDVVHDGSGEMTLQFKGKELSVSQNGSGDLVLSGSVQSFELDADGSGDSDASLLKAEVVDVSNDGSGNVSVNVEHELSINLSGSGDVRYKGDPQQLKQENDGSGSIVRLN